MCQEKDKVRMVQKSIVGHCGMCLGTVPLQRNTISQGHNLTLLHTTVLSSEQSLGSFHSPWVSGFQRKCFMTFISLDTKKIGKKLTSAASLGCPKL